MNFEEAWVNQPGQPRARLISPRITGAVYGKSVPPIIVPGPGAVNVEGVFGALYGKSVPLIIVPGAVYVEGVDSNCLRRRRNRKAITRAVINMANPPMTAPTISPTSNPLLVTVTELEPLGPVAVAVPEREVCKESL